MKLNVYNVTAWLRRRKIEYTLSLPGSGADEFVDSVVWFSNQGSVPGALAVDATLTAESRTRVVLEKGVLLVSIIEPEALFFEFLTMFRTYNSLERRALGAAYYRRSLSEVVSVAVSLFECPAVIVSDDGALLAGDEAVYEKGKQEKGKLPVIRVDFSHNFANIVRYPEGYSPDVPSEVRVSLWLANNRIGRLIYYGATGELDPGVEHLLSWIAKIAERIMALTPQKHYMSSDVNHKLYALLIDQDAGDIETTFSGIDWKSGDRCVFAVVSGFYGSDQMELLTAALSDLTGAFRHLDYHGRYIILGNTYRDDKMKEHIRTAVQSLGMKLFVSFSYPFYGWKNLYQFFRSAYSMADYALSNEIDFLEPEQYLLTRIRRSVASSELLSSLSHPDLERIAEHDRRHGTEYMKDLEVYLSTGCRIRMSGEVLDIHPNTMRYRISQIEKLLGGNLYDPAYRRELTYALLLPTKK